MFKVPNIVEFNEENKAALGENFFPVATYNDKSYSYDFEYEFFVRTYIKFASDIYGVSKDSEFKMQNFLHTSIDSKIIRGRYMFFVGILGHYYKLGNSFYNDLGKNPSMIFFDKLVKNDNGDVASSRVFMVRQFVEEHLSDSSRFEELKEHKLEQVAYGKKAIAKYKEVHELGNVMKIYNLARN